VTVVCAVGTLYVDYVIEPLRGLLARHRPDEVPTGPGPVLAYVGADVPRELLRAAGGTPYRLAGRPGFTAAADRFCGPELDPVARSQLARILTGELAGCAGLVLSADCAASVRIHRYLAEIGRVEPVAGVPPVTFADVLHGPHRSSAVYTAGRLRRLAEVLGGWTGTPVTAAGLAAAIGRAERGRLLGVAVQALRTGAGGPRLRGSEALAVFGAGLTSDDGDHDALLGALLDRAGDLPAHAGVRVFLTGSGHDRPAAYELIESRGAVIVGEDHDWGALVLDRPVPGGEPYAALARAYGRGAPAAAGYGTDERAAYTARRATDARAQLVIAWPRTGDEAPAWDVAAQRELLAEHGISLLALPPQPYGDPVDPAVLDRLDAALTAAAIPPAAAAGPGAAPIAGSEPVAGGGTEPAPGTQTSSASAATAATTPATAAGTEPAPAGAAAGPRPRRPAPRLASAAAATAYQREWFAGLRGRAAAGDPVALVNADTPQEILRALGIPYVVNQWWAAVCAANRRSGPYLELLAGRGYPADQDPYNLLALASTYDPDPPWGGLPPIRFVLAETTGDVLGKVFASWQREHGATFLDFESTVSAAPDPRWWERVETDWESVFGTDRIELMTAELTGVIRTLEQATGRAFDEARFGAVMELVNEQQRHNRAARDLIAATVPAPIGIADTIPSVMIPQWHRGTEWARDAARAFHHEVRDRVEAGAAACPDERIRLMWVGTGLWHDLGFYEWFEQRYGAVFVWSMYLGIAADGYIRTGPDPLRALAGRFAAFGELINSPPWASEWYAKEARHNQVDGAVHLAGADRRGNWFVDRALEAAGVPVLRLAGDSADARGWDEAANRELIGAFLTERVEPVAARRRERR
jgi:benzoyl-CoA reductase/2-hydroxyglutaryl-CoA dehydratase subunit BcrC/BadD/HgdB